jgi:L-aminopeptidase/D-esterase-like protein
VHAIVLAGGSAFGLDAASGVMRWLDERGIGATIGAPVDGVAAPFVVPIVPAAILFDLWVGDARIRPDAAAGHAACEAASSDSLAEGNVGAGAGASVGKLFGIGRAMKGGIGTASIEVGGITVAALVAVNASATSSIRAPAASSPVRAPPTARSSSARCARSGAASCRHGSSRAAPPARRRRSRSSPPMRC